MIKLPEKHVFVCINNRDNGRKSCGEKGLSIRTELVKLAALDNNKNPLRVNKSGCLGVCEKGPALVIYPDAIWYKEIDEVDCSEIYEKSIKNNDKITRLLLKEKDL